MWLSLSSAKAARSPVPTDLAAHGNNIRDYRLDEVEASRYQGAEARDGTRKSASGLVAKQGDVDDEERGNRITHRPSWRGCAVRRDRPFRALHAHRAARLGADLVLVVGGRLSRHRQPASTASSRSPAAGQSVARPIGYSAFSANGSHPCSPAPSLEPAAVSRDFAQAGDRANSRLRRFSPCHGRKWISR